VAALDRDDLLAQVAEIFSPDERRELLNFGHAVADASGEKNAREEQFLQRVAGQWGLEAVRVARSESSKDVLDSPRPSPRAHRVPPEVQREEPKEVVLSEKDWLAALEIDAKTALTAELVRRQFNLLFERYAPEKFATAGPEFVAVAERKRAAVRAAAT